MLPPLHSTVADGVLDRLADVMLCADDVLSIVNGEDSDGALRGDATRYLWVAPIVQRIYDDVNDLMKRLLD